MAIKQADRVKETSTTTGTGAYSLAGAVTGFRTFVAGIGDGNRCYYVAEEAGSASWEVGLGLVTDATPDTLTRTRVIASSSGSAINWPAGTRTLYCAPLAAAFRDIKPPAGYIYGLTLSNNGGDLANDITVDVGECTDESGEVVIERTAQLTKQIDVAFAEGNVQGGMNTGSVANNTWYEVLLIYRQDTGAVDMMFSTTANRATLPTNYTHKRRIGWVRRATATNLAFLQVEDVFTLLTPINDVAVAKTTTATAVTLTVPPNTIARFRAGVDANTTVNANAATVFKEIAEDTTNPAAATGIASLGYADLATWYTAAHFELRADANSQIEHDSEVAQGNLDISTYGWIDRRRRLGAY